MIFEVQSLLQSVWVWTSVDCEVGTKYFRGSCNIYDRRVLNYQATRIVSQKILILIYTAVTTLIFYAEDGVRMFLRIFGIYLPDYTVSHSRKS
jgi:hypothetical protein